jgi:hypothetical protein
MFETEFLTAGRGFVHKTTFDANEYGHALSIVPFGLSAGFRPQAGAGTLSGLGYSCSVHGRGIGSECKFTIGKFIIGSLIREKIFCLKVWRPAWRPTLNLTMVELPAAFP